MSTSSGVTQATSGETRRASGEGMHAVATQSVFAPERDNVAHGGAKAQLRRLAGGAWSLGAVHPPGQHTKEAVFVDAAEPQLSEAADGHSAQSWDRRNAGVTRIMVHAGFHEPFTSDYT